MKKYLRFYRFAKRFITAPMLMAMFALTGGARADIFEPGDAVVVQVSAFNTHYHHDPKHSRYSPLVSVEWHRQSGWLYGGALFMNSFRQFSQSLYAGHIWGLGNSGFYVKLVAGAIHGYSGEHKDKVPFNDKGVFPIILPSIGYRVGAAQIETQFLGLNGLMVTAGFAFH